MKLKPNQKYQYKNITIFIDHINNSSVYYRQWQDGELVGLFSMPRDEFKKHIRVAELIDTPAEKASAAISNTTDQARGSRAGGNA